MKPVWIVLGTLAVLLVAGMGYLKWLDSRPDDTGTYLQVDPLSGIGPWGPDVRLNETVNADQPVLAAALAKAAKGDSVKIRDEQDMAEVWAYLKGLDPTARHAVDVEYQGRYFVVYYAPFYG